MCQKLNCFIIVVQRRNNKNEFCDPGFLHYFELIIYFKILIKFLHFFERYCVAYVKIRCLKFGTDQKFSYYNLRMFFNLKEITET